MNNSKSQLFVSLLPLILSVVLLISSSSVFVSAGTVTFRTNLSFAPDSVTTRNDRTKITAFDEGFIVLRSLDQRTMLIHNATGTELWKWQFNTTVPADILSSSGNTEKAKMEIIENNFDYSNIYLSVRTGHVISCSPVMVEARNLTTGDRVWYKYLGLQTDGILLRTVCTPDATVFSENENLLIIPLPPALLAIDFVSGETAWNVDYPDAECLVGNSDGKRQVKFVTIPATFSDYYPQRNSQTQQGQSSSSSSTLYSTSSSTQRQHRKNRRRADNNNINIDEEDDGESTTTITYHGLFHDSFVSLQGGISTRTITGKDQSMQLCVFNGKTGNLTFSLTLGSLVTKAVEMIGGYGAIGGKSQLYNNGIPGKDGKPEVQSTILCMTGQRGVVYFLIMLVNLPVFCSFYASNSEMRFCIQSQYGAKSGTPIIDLQVSPYYNFATLYRSVPVFTIEVFFVDNDNIESTTVTRTWSRTKTYLATTRPILCLDAILLPYTPSEINIPVGTPVVGMSDQIRAVGTSTQTELWKVILGFSFVANLEPLVVQTNADPSGAGFAEKPRYMFQDFGYSCKVKTKTDIPPNSGSNTSSSGATRTDSIIQNHQDQFTTFYNEDESATEHQTAMVFLNKEQETLVGYDLTEAELKPYFRVPFDDSSSNKNSSSSSSLTAPTLNYPVPLSSVHGAGGSGGVVITFDSSPSIIGISLGSGQCVFRTPISQQVSPLAYKGEMPFGILSAKADIFAAVSMEDGNISLYSLRNGELLQSSGDENVQRLVLTEVALPVTNVILSEPVAGAKVAVTGACRSQIWLYYYDTGSSDGDRTMFYGFELNFTTMVLAKLEREAKERNQTFDENSDSVRRIVAATPNGEDYCVRRLFEGPTGSIFLELSSSSSSSSSSKTKTPHNFVALVGIETDDGSKSNNNWFSLVADGVCKAGQFSTTTASNDAMNNELLQIVCAYNETHLLFLWIDNGTIATAFPFAQLGDETTDIKYINENRTKMITETIVVARSPSTAPIFNSDGTVNVIFSYGVATYAVKTFSSSSTSSSSTQVSFSVSRLWIHTFQPSLGDTQITLPSNQTPIEQRCIFENILTNNNPPEMVFAMAGNSGKIIGFAAPTGSVLFEYTTTPFIGKPLFDEVRIIVMSTISVVGYETPSPIEGDYCFSANSNTWSVHSDPARSAITRIVHPQNRRFYYLSAREKAFLNLDNLIIPTKETNARFYSMFDSSLGFSIPFSIGQYVSEVDFSYTSQTVSVRGTKATVDMQRPVQNDGTDSAWTNMVAEKRKQEQQQQQQQGSSSSSSSSSSLAGCPSTPYCPPISISPTINFHSYIDTVAAGKKIEDIVSQLGSIGGYLGFDLQSITKKLIPSKLDELYFGPLFTHKAFTVIWQSDTSNTIWGSGFASVNVPLTPQRLTRKKVASSASSSSSSSDELCNSILDIPLRCSSFRKSEGILNLTTRLEDLPSCSQHVLTDYITRWMFIVGSCSEEQIRNSKPFYSSSKISSSTDSDNANYSNNHQGQNKNSANLIEELTFEYNCKLWINRETCLPFDDDNNNEQKPSSSNNNSSSNSNNKQQMAIDLGQLRPDNSRIIFQCTSDGRVLGYLSTSLSFLNDKDEDEAVNYMQGPFILIINISAAPTYASYPFNIFSKAPSFFSAGETQQQQQEGYVPAENTRTAQEVASLIAAFSSDAGDGLFGRSGQFDPEYLTQLLISEPDNTLAQQLLFVEPFLGVQFSCTTCSPYFDMSNTPQPTGFLILGAIKTMILLIVSYRFQEAYGLTIRKFIGKAVRVVVKATALADWQKDAHARFAQLLEKEFYPPVLTQKDVHKLLSEWLPELDKDVDPSIKTAKSEFASFFCISMSIDGQRVIRSPSDSVFDYHQDTTSTGLPGMAKKEEKEINRNKSDNDIKTDETKKGKNLKDLEQSLMATSSSSNNTISPDDDNDDDKSNNNNNNNKELEMEADSRMLLSNEEEEETLSRRSSSSDDTRQNDKNKNNSTTKMASQHLLTDDHDTVLISGGEKNGRDIIRKALEETFEAFASAYDKIGFASALYDEASAGYMADELELEEGHYRQGSNNNNNTTTAERMLSSYRQREQEVDFDYAASEMHTEDGHQCSPNIIMSMNSNGDETENNNNTINNNNPEMIDGAEESRTSLRSSATVSFSVTSSSSAQYERNAQHKILNDQQSSNKRGRKTSTSATSSVVSSVSKLETAGKKLKRKQLEAVRYIQDKQHVLQEVLDNHPEWCRKAHIADLPTRANDSLLPIAFMVRLGIAYTLCILFVALYEVIERNKLETTDTGESSSLSSSSQFSKIFDPSNPLLQRGWFAYQNIYFHVCNAGVTSATIVSAAARYFLLRRPQFSDKLTLIISVVIVLPPLCTHIIPAVVLYGWIYFPILIIAYFIRRRMFRQRAIFGQTPFMYRVIARAFVFLIASWMMSSAFNLACVYMYRESNGSYVPQGVASIEKGGTSSFYLEALGLEWHSRSVVCTLNNFARSLTMLVRNLGTLGPVLS